MQELGNYFLPRLKRVMQELLTIVSFRQACVKNNGERATIGYQMRKEIADESEIHTHHRTNP